MLKELDLLKDFFSQYKWQYVLGLVWLIVTDSLELMLPFLLGRIVDGLDTGALGLNGVLRYAGLIAGLAVLMAGARYSWRIYIFGASRRLEYHLRDQLFHHLQTLSPEYYDHHKTGDLMAHATNDLQAVRRAGGEGVLMAADAFYLTGATVVMMVSTVDWRLTLLGMLPLPFLAAGSGVLGRMIHQRFRQVQSVFSDLTDRVQENIAGIRVVKSFVQENRQEQRFGEKNDQYFSTYRHLIGAQALLDPLTQFIAMLSFAITLGVGGTMVINGRISVGDFVAFNSYLGMLIWPMLAVGWVVNLIQRGRASLARLSELMAEEPTVFDPPQVAARAAREGQQAIRGNLEFRDLTFRYGPELDPVLRGINLSVRAGQTLGIVGPTGSGKSTLMDLLLRLYNPPEGSVLIDGTDILDIPLEVIRRDIGYAPQETFLFSKTIRDNIAFAPEAAPDTASSTVSTSVKEAARMAQIDEEIDQFPQQYDTVLGERGVTLSGGQKQRLGIARAIIKSPAVLILDDSLSAVDARTEQKILQGLREVMADRTSIVISHRVVAVKDADKIVYMEDGQIVERGSHEQLVERQGAYWRLNQQQLGSGIESA